MANTRPRNATLDDLEQKLAVSDTQVAIALQLYEAAFMNAKALLLMKRDLDYCRSQQLFDEENFDSDIISDVEVMKDAYRLARKNYLVTKRDNEELRTAVRILKEQMQQND